MTLFEQNKYFTNNRCSRFYIKRQKASKSNRVKKEEHNFIFANFPSLQKLINQIKNKFTHIHHVENCINHFTKCPNMENWKVNLLEAEAW